ncbi:amidohydrolase family-domain-containing protein [Ilyonectria sp. MPI-CAGE-AT-0026]|nr:amidohydrolase family-domain-containing protein [Ilyonectria sp. MPI-CAGE-AT-0026]
MRFWCVAKIRRFSWFGQCRQRINPTVLSRQRTRAKINPHQDEMDADILIRAKSVVTLYPEDSELQAISIRNGYIAAVSGDAHGLDDCVGPSTLIIDERGSTVFPALDDTHTHLMVAGLSQFDVPVHTARSVDEMLTMLGKRAAEVEAGSWITTTWNWLEYNLEEQRLPTAQELDKVSVAHPIVVRRGGHNLVANSLALKLGGITADMASPAGGKIGRDDDGRLDGHLQDAAMAGIMSIMPAPSLSKRMAGIEQASASYAATGIGCVRDCAVPVEDLDMLKRTHDAGKLHVRMRALMSTMGMNSAAQVAKLLDKMEAWRHLQFDPWLSVWGVKFILDGGLEANATEEPYIGRPDVGCCGSDVGNYRGTLIWDPDELFQAMDMVVRSGWCIGTHAFGDRAVRVLLDVYERLLHHHPHLPPNTLVMEHGGLATPDQRSRAIGLGIPCTIQHPLIHEAAAFETLYLGKERVARCFPARGWLDSGGLVAGGSDYPVGVYGPMRSVWGMTTRQTVAGIMGPEHAIRVEEAIAMHTTLATTLLGESDTRGTIAPGRFADLTIWPWNPLTAQDPSDLRDLLPLYTIVGGKLKHSPTKGT